MPVFRLRAMRVFLVASLSIAASVVAAKAPAPAAVTPVAAKQTAVVVAANPLAVEAGATLGWWKYVGSDGRVLGIDRFGASGKAADLFPHFGFTADNVGRQIRELTG